MAGPDHSIFLVHGRGYLPFYGRCTQLADLLAAEYGRKKTEQVVRTRPLCPFPQVAAYKGTGSPNDAANFVCR